MTIAKFDRDTAIQLRRSLERKLQDLEDDLGVKTTIKPVRLGSTTTITVEIVVFVGDDVKLGDTPDGRLFKAYASHYGLKPEWIGQTFNSRGTLYKILGLKTNRPKYPIDAERVCDGVPFKFPARVVQSAMEGRR